MKTGTGNLTEKSWLIKSSTRILGPHSIEEVAQLLLKKHISIIDEVRQPSGRWKYIREHGVFNEAVEALRAEQASSAELTQTQTHTHSQTHTLTQTLTQPLTRTDLIGSSGNENTLTPIPPATPAPGAQVSPFPGVKDVAVLKETTTLRSGPSSGGYGSWDDLQVRREVVRSQAKFRWLISALVAIVILGIFGVQGWRTLKRNEGYDFLIQQAVKLKSLQLYERSLSAYKRATQIKEPSVEIQSEMALLLIVLDRQNVHGRRILEEEIAGAGGNRNRLVDATLGIAISYILEGSLREAEDALQKVLVLEPSNFNARLNLGLVALRKGDWTEAARQLEDLTRRSNPHPLVLIGRAVSLIEGRDAERMQKARALAFEIDGFTRQSFQLKQELLMMKSALLAMANAPLREAVRSFLFESSGQSDLFAKDLRLDWRVANWEFLERYCRQFTGQPDPDAAIKASRAVCLAKAGKEGESRTVLKEALTAAPKDPAVLFAQANILYQAKLRNEAFAVLRMPELAQLPYAKKLLAQVCLEQGDQSCAESNFAALMKGVHRDPMVLAGMASIYMRQNGRSKAQTLVREGLSAEPSYLPFIELREAVNGEVL